jgi:hypothetical protein
MNEGYCICGHTLSAHAYGVCLKKNCTCGYGNEGSKKKEPIQIVDLILLGILVVIMLVACLILMSTTTLKIWG